MLQNIRDRSQGWVAWIIVILIALTFGLWGISYYLHDNKSNDTAVTVNGQPISQQKLDKLYQNQVLALQQQNTSGNFILTQAVSHSLRQQILFGLLKSTVVQQAVSKQGFKISKSQIDSFVLALPQFQQDGQFSEALFMQWLSQGRTTQDEFFKQVQDYLLVVQTMFSFEQTSFAIPQDVQTLYRLNNQKRKFSYLVIPDAKYSVKAQISEQQLKQYYNAHLNDFLQPARISIDYVKLSVADIQKNIHPTKQEIDEYYNSNTDNFTYQKDGKKIVKPLSDPSVQTQIITSIKSSEAQKDYAQQKEALADKVFETPNTLKSTGLQVQTTGLFTRDGAKKGLTSNAKVVEAAFSENVKESNYNSDVIDLSSTEAIVLRKHEFQKAAPLPFAKAKVKILATLKDKYGQKIARQKGGDALLALQKGETQASVAKKFSTAWHTTSLVTRRNEGIAPQILSEAFRLNPNGLGSVATNTGFVLVKVQQVENPKQLTGKDDMYHSFQESIADQRGQADYQLFQYELLKKAKIEPESIKEKLLASL